MEQDIWSKTYRNDRVADLPGIQVISSVSDFHGPRTIAARIAVAASAGEGVRFELNANMTAAQMRALATLLAAHADRIEHELTPLLRPEAEIIPFAPLYHEPESA